jgi:hypothetical protein
MQYSDLDLALLYYDLAVYQIELVRRGKVRLVLVHECKDTRLPGRCVSGERLLSAWIVHQGRSYILPLSTPHLALLDCLARHSMGIGLNAAQIQERLNSDLFYVHLTGVRSSRTAVRQQVRRIRASMAKCFTEANLNLNPADILRSEPTSSNEVRYAINADVVIEH